MDETQGISMGFFQREPEAPTNWQDIHLSCSVTCQGCFIVYERTPELHDQRQQFARELQEDGWRWQKWHGRRVWLCQECAGDPDEDSGLPSATSDVDVWDDDPNEV